MTEIESPFQTNPPPVRKLLITTVVAVLLAAVALVTIVLPAEYGIDPTGFGKLTGLTALNSGGDPTRTLEIADVVGGNETYKEVELPDFGEPLPLPNPAVFQSAGSAPESRQVVIEMQPYDETEIKLVMQQSKVAMFDWSIDQGAIYVDFHGHDPELGNEYWVRYEEGVEASGGAGSLVAPFKGEHGWYFVNYNDFPVTVTIEVEGYFDQLIDYGVWNPLGS